MVFLVESEKFGMRTNSTFNVFYLNILNLAVSSPSTVSRLL